MAPTRGACSSRLIVHLLPPSGLLAPGPPASGCGRGHWPLWCLWWWSCGPWVAAETPMPLGSPCSSAPSRRCRWASPCCPCSPRPTQRWGVLLRLRRPIPSALWRASRPLPSACWCSRQAPPMASAGCPRQASPSRIGCCPTGRPTCRCAAPVGPGASGNPFSRGAPRGPCSRYGEPGRCRG